MAPLEIGLHLGEELEGAGERILRQLEPHQIERIHVDGHHTRHAVAPNDTVQHDLTFYIRRRAAQCGLRLMAKQ